jgi:hypothetical protein
VNLNLSIFNLDHAKDIRKKNELMRGHEKNEVNTPKYRLQKRTFACPTGSSPHNSNLIETLMNIFNREYLISTHFLSWFDFKADIFQYEW